MSVRDVAEVRMNLLTNILICMFVIAVTNVASDRAQAQFQLQDNGSIFRWMGKPCDGDSCVSWERLDNNPQTKMIAGGDATPAGPLHLYQLHNDGSIFRWMGKPCDGNSCVSWARLDRNPQTV